MLTNRNIIVTGAAGGIGKELVTALLSAGATVIAATTRPENLEDLSTTYGEKIVTVKCDLSDKSQADYLLQQAIAACGYVDGLVANAGINEDKLVMRMRDEDWERVIEFNLNSTFRLNRAAIKHMLARRYGRIVNISSVIGLTGNAGQANYAASKAGIVAMSKSIALEVATRGITVNCISPGFIATPMTDKLTPEQRDSILQKIPSGRLGEPRDISAAAIFLLSEGSGYITGHNLSVNGGMLMV